MIVDKNGNLFEDRRKNTRDRRKNEGTSVAVTKNRRKTDSRKENNKIKNK